MAEKPFVVEIIEPTRLILKDGESQTYITVAHHETNEKGLNDIKSFEVGDEVEVTFKHKKHAKLDPETNPELPEKEVAEEEEQEKEEEEAPKKTFAALKKKKASH